MKKGRTFFSRASPEVRPAIRIAITYCVIAVLWALISTGTIFIVLPGVEVRDIRWLETASAWFFAIVTSWLLYLMVRASLAEARRTQDAIHLRDQAIESSVNAILIAAANDGQFPIEYVNPAFERITGYREDEVLGRDWRFLQGTETGVPGGDGLREALQERRGAHLVVKSYRKDGTAFWNDMYVSPVHDHTGSVTHYVGILNDITEAKGYQEQLEKRANYDDLTGLANRNFLNELLRSGIAYSKRHENCMAVMMVDLDHFKRINDSLGHSAGDKLLRLVAERLRDCVRESDSIGRIGGDEFVLLLYDEPDERSVSDVAKRILARLLEPCSIDGNELFLSCSIGYCTYPRDGQDAETLLRNADAAMYRAKELGRNTWQVYSLEMNLLAAERLGLEAQLRHAAQRGEFVLEYQPIVDLRTGGISAIEALIRWRHPERGLIAPGEFIPLAEETGLIVPLGEWVIAEACRQNRAWQKQGLPPVRVTVNLSARQFREPQLVERIAEELRLSGLDGRWLEIEITETLLVQNPARTNAVLNELKSLGVTVAMDDFGTGYSSLSYLKHFPIDFLKIDRSFVEGMTTNADDAAITRAIIALARSLRLEVIAEGAETLEQVSQLRSEGCDHVQGYFFSRPLHAEALVHMLRDPAARLPWHQHLRLAEPRKLAS